MIFKSALLRSSKQHAVVRRLFIFLACCGGLLVAILFSLVVGARQIPFEDIVDIFFGTRTPSYELDILVARIPMTITGVFVGSALGVSGSLMQGITRNPLADPGLLGINVGASLFVVIALAFFAISNPWGIMAFAFTGAALAAFGGYALAAASQQGAKPVQLALAGAAVAALCSGLIAAILILDSSTLNTFRFWQLGSLTAASGESLVFMSGFLGVGMMIAVGIAPKLNAFLFGDDMAQTFGVSVGVTRFLTVLAVILLCASATALAGPIGFVGLAVAHVARGIVGFDYRWVVPTSAVLGAAFLLYADVIGRVWARPETIEVGIVTAVLGVPLFIALVRRGRFGAL